MNLENGGGPQLTDAWDDPVNSSFPVACGGPDDQVNCWLKNW